MDENTPPKGKPGRGGSRKYSGRRPDTPGDPMVKRTISLHESDIVLLKVLGDGELSKGVRIAAEIAYEQYQRRR